MLKLKLEASLHVLPSLKISILILTNYCSPKEMVSVKLLQNSNTSLSNFSIVTRLKELNKLICFLFLFFFHITHFSISLVLNNSFSLLIYVYATRNNVLFSKCRKVSSHRLISSVHTQQCH